MFECFARYIGKQTGPNRFWRVNQVDIGDSESRLGIEMPTDLRKFFIEVGSGFWAQGTEDSNWDRSLVNRIPSPIQIADLLCNEKDPWRPREGFEDGVIPFFDVGENTYLIVRPRSESKDCVFWPDNNSIVTHSLREFFGNLQRRAGFYRQS